MLQTTPAMDITGLATIERQTKSDTILSDLTALIEQGKTWISKTADPKLRKFEKILPETTVTSNGILLKADCIILLESLPTNCYGTSTQR